MNGVRVAARVVVEAARVVVCVALLVCAVLLATTIFPAAAAGLPISAGEMAVYTAAIVLSVCLAWRAWPGAPQPARGAAAGASDVWDAEAEQLERLWRAPARHPPHDPPGGLPLRPAVPPVPDPMDQTLRDVVARHPVDPITVFDLQHLVCSRCGGLVAWDGKWTHADDEYTRLRVIVADAETFPDGPW